MSQSSDFAAITLCVASQRVFVVVVVVVVVVISLSTQSGNFWMHPCIVFLYDGFMSYSLS